MINIATFDESNHVRHMFGTTPVHDNLKIGQRFEVQAWASLSVFETSLGIRT